jgi:hypothetical protein
MIIAVHQPQYLPWIGYFHKMDKADVFVLLDKTNGRIEIRLKLPRAGSG